MSTQIPPITRSASSKTGAGTSNSQDAGGDSESTSNSRIDYPSDARFAVVMYGGVSLAIYINGVAQELLHMVRATASDGKAKLSATEKVYRRVSYLLADDQDGRLSTDAENDQSGPPPTRFVVDIVSGTSAGGINGVFLA